MRIGILGTGDVGRTLANAFIELGHEVKMGARDARNEKALAWQKSAGPRASVGTFAEAATFGEINVLATLGAANASAIEQAGVKNLAGKILIDTTNPLDFSKGMPPSLAISGNDSAGEQVQRQAEGAKVVKCFNIVGHANMFRPRLPGGPPDMLICGEDEGAKRKVAELLKDFGWPNTTDLGGIACSRYLEPMCIVWVLYGVKNDTWGHAFKLLK